MKIDIPIELSDDTGGLASRRSSPTAVKSFTSPSPLPTTGSRSHEQRTPLIPARPPTVRPLAPERHEFRFTASAEARANLREVQDLLRHTIPSGDPAQIIERALKLLVEQLRRKKYAVTDRPRAGGVANIRLLCRAHNAFESERFYGHRRPVKNPTLPGASCPPRRSATARDADPPSQIRAGGP